MRGKRINCDGSGADSARQQLLGSLVVQTWKSCKQDLGEGVEVNMSSCDCLSGLQPFHCAIFHLALADWRHACDVHRILRFADV